MIGSSYVSAMFPLARAGISAQNLDSHAGRFAGRSQAPGFGPEPLLALRGRLHDIGK